VLFFFCEETAEIHQGNTERDTTNLEITDPSSCRSMSTTRRETCRRRAAAPSPLMPWMEEDPRADGKSSGLELRRASASLHRQHRLGGPPAASKVSTGSAATRSGRGLSAHGDPGGPRARGRGRSAATLQRAPPPERKSTTCKTNSNTSRATISLTPPAKTLATPTLCTRRGPRFRAHGEAGVVRVHGLGVQPFGDDR
jgi:hypothetical protein